MSVLAVSDVVFKDLLSQLDLKPWCDKLRGYCFAVSVVSALFMVYVTLSSTGINCLPLYEENVTTCTTISTTEAQFFNNYCSNQLPWEVSFYGLSPLGGCMIIIIFANWWTMLPNVVNSFRTFVRFEKIIEELNLPSDKLCELSTKLINPKKEDESMKIRKACTLLWKYKSSTSLKCVYVIRNIILILIIVLFILALGRLLDVLHRSEMNNFECQVNDIVQNILYGKTNVTKRYLCSYNTKNHIPFVWIMMLSLIAQCIVVVSWLSYLCWKTGKKSNCLSKKSCQTYHDINFMIQFWKNSRPENSGAIKKLVGHIFSAALTEFKMNLENAAIVDIDMLEHYLSLKKDGWKDAFPALESAILNDFRTNIIDDRMNTSTESSASDSNLNSDKALLHSRIAQCIRYSVPRCSLKNFFEFFVFLCEQKCWEIIANILVSDASDWIEDDRKYGLSKITIDSNEIGKPFESQCSILYYLLVGKLLDTYGTKFIIERFGMCNESSRYYVHFHGQTRKTSKILSKAPNKKTKSGSVAEILIIKDLLTFGDVERNLSSYIAELEKGNYNFAQELSRYKFIKWNEQRQKLAGLANSKEQWEILVALLNAFIVEYEEDTSDPLDTGCRVREFAKNINETSDFGILGTALSPDPLYGARITAVRHIVNFTQGKVTNSQNAKTKYLNFLGSIPDYNTSVRIKLNKLLDQLFSGTSPKQPQPETTEQNQSNAPPQDGTTGQNERSAQPDDIQSVNRPLVHTNQKSEETESYQARGISSRSAPRKVDVTEKTPLIPLQPPHDSTSTSGLTNNQPHSPQASGSGSTPPHVEINIP